MISQGSHRQLKKSKELDHSSKLFFYECQRGIYSCRRLSDRLMYGFMVQQQHFKDVRIPNETVSSSSLHPTCGVCQGIMSIYAQIHR